MLKLILYKVPGSYVFVSPAVSITIGPPLVITYYTLRKVQRRNTKPKHSVKDTTTSKIAKTTAKNKTMTMMISTTAQKMTTTETTIER